jgi:CheY-like chemotaxis protein
MARDEKASAVDKLLRELGGGVKGEKPVVLVAEDEPNVRRILVHFLKQAGYDVLEAADGKHACRTVESSSVSVILMDVMMPFMDGFEACKRIKENPLTRHIPVLICTAKSHRDDVFGALKAGADDYILKPFTRDTILEKVEKALQRAYQQKPKVGIERRQHPRKAVDLTLSWSPNTSGAGVVYKTKVTNISRAGLCFEIDTCPVCTGYVEGAVHQDCPFSGYYMRSRTADELEMLLSISPHSIFRTCGKVVHVHRPPESKRECVGVLFTRLSDSDTKALTDFLMDSRIFKRDDPM